MARILIADDNEHVRVVLRRMLRHAGHEVAEAADGAEAVAACRREPFDLLFCDLFMPNKEGLETIRELRQEFPRLAIVAMSGGLAGGGDFLKAARLIGADAALPKPFDHRRLLDALAEALGRTPTSDPPDGPPGVS